MMTRLLSRFFATPQFNARTWSNAELNKLGPLLAGRVLNVSGGADSDKEGRRYRDYFKAAREYAVSNYGTLAGVENEFAFDLEQRTLPEALSGRYDIVFSHTVLEHVFDIHAAVANLCALSGDVIVTVVPFLQSYHHDTWYGDYWRFSPTALQRLFGDKGFETVYLNWNEDPLGNIYVLHVCARHPSRWQAIATLQPLHEFGPGVSRNHLLFGAGGREQAAIALHDRHEDARKSCTTG